MQAVSLEILGRLHDAVVHGVYYDATGTNRDVRLSMTCSKRIDFEAWVGRRVSLVAHDVLAMRHLIWATADPEQLNLITTEMSDDAKKQLRLFDGANSRFTGKAPTIAFQSGSSLELLCREYALEVDIEPQHAMNSTRLHGVLHNPIVNS
jgi:hypothetical protein